MALTKNASQTISPAEMKDALSRSGYLLESRLAAYLTKTHWFVDSNQAFLDPDANISREIDLYADSSDVHFVSHDPPIFVSVELAIEAINNPLPAVFFQGSTNMTSPIVDRIRFCCTPPIRDEASHFTNGIELEVWHQCDPLESCSQYCTFKRKGSGQQGEWMAFHPDDFHETVKKLALFTEHKKVEYDQSFSSLDDTATRLTIIQPVIVLGGALYRANTLARSVALKPTSRLFFEYSYHQRQQARSLWINVVREPYFKNHVESIEAQAHQLGESILKRIAAKSGN